MIMIKITIIINYYQHHYDDMWYIIHFRDFKAMTKNHCFTTCKTKFSSKLRRAVDKSSPFRILPQRE